MTKYIKVQQKKRTKNSTREHMNNTSDSNVVPNYSTYLALECSTAQLLSLFWREQKNSLSEGVSSSPLIALETAQQERSRLLSGDKRLLREGRSVDLLCNQKEKYESLKLILIRLKCMCFSPGAPKKCTYILMWSVCPIPNNYAGMHSCIKVMMW